MAAEFVTAAESAWARGLLHWARCRPGHRTEHYREGARASTSVTSQIEPGRVQASSYPIPFGLGSPQRNWLNRTQDLWKNSRHMKGLKKEALNLPSCNLRRIHGYSFIFEHSSNHMKDLIISYLSCISPMFWIRVVFIFKEFQTSYPKPHQISPILL